MMLSAAAKASVETIPDSVVLKNDVAHTMEDTVFFYTSGVLITWSARDKEQ